MINIVDVSGFGHSGNGVICDFITKKKITCFPLLVTGLDGAPITVIAGTLKNSYY
jgi:hypothetical protein